MHKLDTGRARERGVEGFQVFFSQLKNRQGRPPPGKDVIAVAFSRRRGGFDGLRR
jgi:hypothetical protein